MNARVANATDELIDARLRMGDAVRFTIPTSSMYPALVPGDQVIVRGTRATELRVGDVVIVKGDASVTWIAHRLIARRVVDETLRLVTKGDNCSVADPPWRETQLIGCAVAMQRQRATRSSDLMSGRARAVNACLAFFSRGQVFAESKTREACPEQDRRVARRIALKVSRILIRAGGFAARWMIG